MSARSHHLEYVVVDGDENPVSDVYPSLKEAMAARDGCDEWTRFSIVSIRYDENGHGEYTGQEWVPGHDTPLGPVLKGVTP